MMVELCCRRMHRLQESDHDGSHGHDHDRLEIENDAGHGVQESAI